MCLSGEGAEMYFGKTELVQLQGTRMNAHRHGRVDWYNLGPEDHGYGWTYPLFRSRVVTVTILPLEQKTYPTISVIFQP